MGKNLYLNEDGSGIVVKRDGPSVWITSRSSAGRRIPARLLGRVVIIGNVHLDAGAITLFTDNDVPVVFMNRSSDESAVAIPYNHRLAKHYEEQKVFLESPQNTSRYECWAKTKRMTIQLKVLNRLFKKTRLNHEIGEGNYQMLLKGFKPDNEEQWTIVSDIVANLFRGLIIEHLIKADIDPHMGVIHRRHNLGLALDICYIMGAEGDTQSLQFFRSARNEPFIHERHGRWETTGSGMRNIIHRFENRAEALHTMVDNIIDELFELMRELRHEG
jgi:hypothetical protein